MKKSLLILVLGVLVLLMGGCVSISKETAQSENETVIAKTIDWTISEIDAASRMSFDEDRQKAYKEIALRAALDETVQAYLVQAVFDHLAFESAKEDVLITIIRNPGFNGAGRSAILGSINKLAFENGKQKILRAIGDRRI